MKGKELAEQLLKYPDFDVVFSFSEKDNSEWGMTVRRWEDISVEDIGHSNKVLLLGGTEK